MIKEISRLLVVLLLSVGLLACSPEKPESKKAAEGKSGSTNEVVIADTDANALPLQEEDFSEEAKARLKKLREEAAIFKAEAELNNQKVEANAAAAIVSGKPTTLFTKKSRSSTYAYEENGGYIPIKFEEFSNRAKGVLYNHPEMQQALLEKFVEFSGEDKVMDDQETELFQQHANELLQKADFSDEKRKKYVNFLLGNGADIPAS